MAFSVAPTTNTEYMTIVGPLAEWEHIIKKMSGDRSCRDVASAIKPQLNKQQNVQRITLPIVQARTVLRFCNMSW